MSKTMVELKLFSIGMLLVLGISAVVSAHASWLPPKHPPVIITECGVPVRAYMMTEHGLYKYSGSAATQLSRTVSPLLWSESGCGSAAVK